MKTLKGILLLFIGSWVLVACAPDEDKIVKLIPQSAESSSATAGSGGGSGSSGGSTFPGSDESSTGISIANYPARNSLVLTAISPDEKQEMIELQGNQNLLNSCGVEAGDQGKEFKLSINSEKADITWRAKLDSTQANQVEAYFNRGENEDRELPHLSFNKSTLQIYDHKEFTEADELKGCELDVEPLTLDFTHSSGYHFQSEGYKFQLNCENVTSQGQELKALRAEFYCHYSETSYKNW